MTAFILSGTIAFALYELLAFAEWPTEQTDFHYFRLTEQAARVVRKVIRSLIVIVILLAVLTIHEFAAPIKALARYEVNIIFGFAFGPLFAIWVNSVIIHSPNEDLSRGQIFGAIGLALLFVVGVIGSESSGLIRQYARNLTSLKLGVAELSFAAKEKGSRERLASTAISGTNGAYVPGGSNGLQNLAVLDGIIKRDREYLRDAFTPKSLSMPDDDLERIEKFATATIAHPMNCLFAWFQQTADSGPVENYLSRYSDAFRRLEALNTAGSASDGAMDAATRVSALNDVSSDFVWNGLRMALDILQSTTSEDVLKQCKKWFEIYCPPDEMPAGVTQKSYDRQCIREASKQFSLSPNTPKTGKVQERISFLAQNLEQMIAPPQSVNGRGLEALPYFAIGRASLMTQLGQHEAAAAVLDDWLHARLEDNSTDERQDEYKRNPQLQIRDEWFALRIRSMLVAYVEEWLEDERSEAATIVETEHLRNLQATIDGFKARLMKADFFRKLDESCRTKCEPAFRRPEVCQSDEPPARLQLWRRLYSSYVTMEYAYIHRALEHPDYAKFADAVNDEARRIVNFDLSCGTKAPEPKALYGQSLLAFAENAIAYSRLRAKTDDQVTREKRLDDAERAAKFGLEMVDELAKVDQERSSKRYVARIAPSLVVQLQEQLRSQLAKIERTRAELAE